MPPRSGTYLWPRGCRGSAPPAPPYTSAPAPSTGAAHTHSGPAAAAGNTPSETAPTHTNTEAMMNLICRECELLLYNWGLLPFLRAPTKLPFLSLWGVGGWVLIKGYSTPLVSLVNCARKEHKSDFWIQIMKTLNCVWLCRNYGEWNEQTESWVDCIDKPRLICILVCFFLEMTAFGRHRYSSALTESI